MLPRRSHIMVFFEEAEIETWRSCSWGSDLWPRAPPLFWPRECLCHGTMQICHSSSHYFRAAWAPGFSKRVCLDSRHSSSLKAVWGLSPGSGRGSWGSLLGVFSERGLLILRLPSIKPSSVPGSLYSVNSVRECVMSPATLLLWNLWYLVCCLNFLHCQVELMRWRRWMYLGRGAVESTV